MVTMASDLRTVFSFSWGVGPPQNRGVPAGGLPACSTQFRCRAAGQRGLWRTRTLTPPFPPQNGLLSALPYLLCWVLSNLAGYLADFFLARKILSLITIRKLFTTLGE